MSTVQQNPLPEGATLKSTSNDKDRRVYRIKKELGHGGFGITYLAASTLYDGNIPQEVTYTIKEFCLSDICTRNADGSLTVLAGHEDEFRDAKKDFLSEARRLYNLSHKGIVPVNEVFEANGTAYYVMQYLGDVSLAKYVVQQGGRLHEEEARQIVMKIAQSLDYLHQQRMTHLDVKPENVMMVPLRDGSLQPVLIDFGLACGYKSNGECTSRHGSSGVSDGYSPLEQYAGITRFSPEADVYALGATFFYMLTGKAPRKASEMDMKYLYAQLPDSLSDSTMDALSNAMQKYPEKRAQNISQFLTKLDADVADLSDGDAGSETKRSSQNKKTKSVPSINIKQYLPYLGGVMAVALVIALAVILFSGRKTVDEEVDEPEVEEELDPVEGPSTSGTVDGESGATTLYEDSLAYADSVAAYNNSSSSSSSSSTSSKYLDLGYAVWNGPVLNGKPDGEGTMSFKSSRVIDSRDPQKRKAESGESVEGYYKNGRLDYGTWYKNDGTKEQIYIGL